MRNILERRIKIIISALTMLMVSLTSASVVNAESEIDVNAIHETVLSIVEQYQDAGIRAAYHNMEPVYKPYYDEDGNLELQPEGYAVIVGEVSEGNLISTVYLDENLELIDEGVAVHKCDFDDEGRLSRELYCDNDGQFVNGELGYARAEYVYTYKDELPLSWYYNASGTMLATGSGYLLKYLQSLQRKNVIVFFAVKDEASNGMTQSIIDEMHNLGIKSSLLGKYRYSFYAVVSPQNVIDNVSEESLEYSGSIGKMEFIVKSAGWDAGNNASIIIDGVEYSKNHRGLNIVVYDNELNSVIDSFAVDTYLSSMPVFR